jgi:hypothetical protein
LQQRTMLEGIRILARLTPIQQDEIATSINAVFPELAMDACPMGAADLALHGADIRAPEQHGRRVLIAAEQWLAPVADPALIDAAVASAARAGAFSIWLWAGAKKAPQLLTAAMEIATRCQRFLPGRNEHSRDALFERIAALHHALHDLSLPLVAADYDHALDTHRWLLRLCPDASLAVQVAALFHDVERLTSESRIRIEQHAPDYVAFKLAHAKAGAALAADTLEEAGAPPELIERVSQLIAGHERPSGDAELELLNEADALSFFSLNASGFVAYYGPAHTELKVRYTLARLSKRGRTALGSFRHHPAIAALIAAETARQSSTVPQPSTVLAP